MACLMLALVALGFGRRRRPFYDASLARPTKEKTK
jgi:hypothetical protein